VDYGKFRLKLRDIMPVTVIKNRFKTIDEAVIFLAESMAKSEAKLAESIAKSDAKIAASDAKIAESDAKMAASRAYFEKKIAESDAKIAESNAKIDSVIQELRDSRKETGLAAGELKDSQEEKDFARELELVAGTVKELSLTAKEVLSGFSSIGRRFGEIVELVVIPGLRRAINKSGHDFKRSTANKKFYYVGGDGQKWEFTEVDLFLSNGTEAMAVEVKATLTAGYVNKQLLRLKRLRDFEKEAKLQGKKLYGAVVGVYVDDDARKLALKNGLYVIDILEEEKKLNVEKPERCHIW
jgi:hypothetical protein